MKELEAIIQRIGSAPFSQQGALYRSVLEFSETLRLAYRDWRLEYFSLFIKEHTSIQAISAVLDVDEEEDLYELWGLTLYFEENEAYLPIHWLNSDWNNYAESPFGAQISEWISHQSQPFTQELWIHLQQMVALLWEDLSYWQSLSYIYNRGDED